MDVLHEKMLENGVFDDHVVNVHEAYEVPDSLTQLTTLFIDNEQIWNDDENIYKAFLEEVQQRTVKWSAQAGNLIAAAEGSPKRTHDAEGAMREWKVIPQDSWVRSRSNTRLRIGLSKLSNSTVLQGLNAQASNPIETEEIFTDITDVESLEAEQALKLGHQDVPCCRHKLSKENQKGTEAFPASRSLRTGDP
jgi:hypothetical protein